ncbi:MAG TPA: UDP-N-acetylglucosamine--N-acetylmuramyl-(pentapeptide) pyrophosphoryl-undecaprenol N-acetylglucosamine transferase [Acidimicrobiales bacterium]|nr:UDP-N-acetylglucosamine--N-acetylmuramyl-(pentapeptide) pyrophosphoryl-undecaprenol N-acetylglucosamine transferase [Acidimicrobiales bacterium]
MSGRRFAVIAGGGTAGHVLVALAVAEALTERSHRRTDITLVGSRRGQEALLLGERGFPLQLLSGRGIARRLDLRTLGANALALAGLAWATVRAAGGLLRRRPRVVVSVGGYASLPAGLAAVVLGVPLVNVTVDAAPGATSRLLGRFARANAVAFAGTPLPRAVVTGAPVRADVHPLSGGAGERAAARAALGLSPGRALVAVFGGSLGAARLNESARALAARWADRHDLCLLQVTGRRNFAAAEAPAEGGRALECKVVPFVEDMGSLYAAADVVVCRAGALSVAELALAGVPAVLVPLPGAPDDHQTRNAMALVDAGAAVLLADRECTGERLAGILEPLLADRGALRAMADAARGLGRPDAAARVAELVDEHAA